MARGRLRAVLLDGARPLRQMSLVPPKTGALVIPIFVAP